MLTSCNFCCRLRDSAPLICQSSHMTHNAHGGRFRHPFDEATHVACDTAAGKQRSSQRHYLKPYHLKNVTQHRARHRPRPGVVLWGDVAREYLASSGDIFADRNSGAAFLASSGQRPEMLLSAQQCRRHSVTRQ